MTNEHVSVSRVLELIAQGYGVEGVDDRYIKVENPDYWPDNGIDPFIVLDTQALRSPHQGEVEAVADRQSKRVQAIVSGVALNHPDPQDDNSRIIGWRVPYSDEVGIGQALIGLDFIRDAALSALQPSVPNTGDENGHGISPDSPRKSENAYRASRRLFAGGRKSRYRVAGAI